MMDDKTELRKIVIELFENREHQQCWFADDGDCANWDTCDSECPIVRLRQAAGIEGNAEGSLPPA